MSYNNDGTVVVSDLTNVQLGPASVTMVTPNNSKPPAAQKVFSDLQLYDALLSIVAQMERVRLADTPGQIADIRAVEDSLRTKIGLTEAEWQSLLATAVKVDVYTQQMDTEARNCIRQAQTAVGTDSTQTNLSITAALHQMRLRRNGKVQEDVQNLKAKVSADSAEKMQAYLHGACRVGSNNSASHADEGGAMKRLVINAKERCTLICCLLVAWAMCVTPATAQTNVNQTDDGQFTVFTYISVAGGNVSAFASTPQLSDYSGDYTPYHVDGPATWTLDGDNYSDSGVGSSFRSGPVPPGSTYTASFYFSIIYSPAGLPPACYFGYVGDLCYGNYEGSDSPVGYASIYVPAPSPPPANSCAVQSNSASGFTSIVPGGINFGISGTFSVSFRGSSFAGLTPPTVAFGLYSTPESIAADMAALITRNYARDGLTAKAFGSNVIYSGSPASSTSSVTFGFVSNVFSGSGGESSSFLANTSPAAATGAGIACENASPPPSVNPISPCVGANPDLGYGDLYPNGEAVRQHIINNRIIENPGVGPHKSKYGVAPLLLPLPVFVNSRFNQVVGYNSLTMLLGTC